MRVEASRETGCRIGRNQSRPGDGRGHAQIDAEASLISRKCPENIGHYHYQGGALRRLLIHAIEEPKQGDHKEATANPEQPTEQTSHPTEARCGGDVNCRCDHCRAHHQRERRIELVGPEIVSARRCINTGTAPALANARAKKSPLLPKALRFRSVELEDIDVQARGMTARVIRFKCQGGDFDQTAAGRNVAASDPIAAHWR